MSKERYARLIAALEQQRLAGAALMPDANLTYLTGLHFHKGKRLTLALLPADGSTPCIIIPALEHTQAEATTSIPMRFFPWADAEGPASALYKAIDTAFGSHLYDLPLAVEYTSMRVMELRALETAWPNLRTSDVGGLMADLRMVKDDAELALIEEAVRIIETALERTIAQIRVGMSERELSKILSEEVAAAGGESESFENLIGSGPNGANPHHNNGDRVFRSGDLIVIDCGARYKGYISDITRTVAVGEPSEEARRVYDLVLQANEAGKRVCRPEVTGAEVDAAARGVIEAGGYGEFFIHRTGHGFGMETHELPNMMAGSNEPLAPGTTFTVEPGIYLPGKFGVRIEDDMVLTADGARSLTSFPRDLIIIPA